MRRSRKPFVFISCLAVLNVCAQDLEYRISTFAGGAPPPSPVRALDTAIGIVFGIAADRTGNVYLTNIDYNCIFQVTPDGALIRFAGNGRHGYSGDGGPATDASLHLDYGSGYLAPVGIAADDDGNVFVADVVNARIRRISRDGIIETVAGNGTLGSSGDGGPATAAQLKVPVAVAVDRAGSLYISERAGYRVRKVSPAGIITTVAGNGSPEGPAGDGGPATSAVVVPGGIAVDRSGNLFLAEYSGRIRRVSPDGKIATVAAANGAPLGAFGIAIDPHDNLLVTQGQRLLKLSADGMLGVVAGTGTPGYSGDGGPAVDAQLGNVLAVGVDGNNNIFVTSDARIRKIGADNIITTVAGTGVWGPRMTGIAFSGDGGPATGAELSWPWGVAVDEHGNLFIADTAHHRVRRVSAGVITTVAGDGNAGFSGDTGPAVHAQLHSPTALALDKAGNLFVLDAGNHRVRKISSGTITTVAGNGRFGVSGDGGAATNAELGPFYSCNVWCGGLATDHDGNLFIADPNNSRVRKVSADGIITTVAGNGNRGLKGDGGPAETAELRYPSGVAVDDQGNLFIAESGRIRKVSQAGIITTLAGGGSLPGAAADGGPALAARLSFPLAVSVDRAGNVFFADPGWRFVSNDLELDPADHRIRKISPEGIITTLAGNGAPGFAGDHGPAKAAQLAGPVALAVGAGGEIYVAEAQNHVIRLLRPEPDGLHRGRPPLK
jgi:sugar lactone lactonase YvrE